MILPMRTIEIDLNILSIKSILFMQYKLSQLLPCNCLIFKKFEPCAIFADVSTLKPIKERFYAILLETFQSEAMLNIFFTFSSLHMFNL